MAKRNVNLSFYVNQSESDALVALAAHRGMSKVEVLRALILEAHATLEKGR
jgi:hypothetical protein